MPTRQPTFFRRRVTGLTAEAGLGDIRHVPGRTVTVKTPDAARRPDSQHALTQDTAWAWLSMAPAPVTANALPAYEVTEHPFPDDLDLAGFLDLIRRLN